MGAGHHRKLATGDVTAHRLHRNILVAQDHAGHGFDLEVLQTGFLLFGEIPHLCLRKLDVFHLAWRDPCHQRLDLIDALFSQRRHHRFAPLGVQGIVHRNETADHEVRIAVTYENAVFDVSNVGEVDFYYRGTEYDGTWIMYFIENEFID